MKKYMALLALALSLTACGEKHHTKEWYKDHPEERHQVAERCMNDAAIEHTPDCENAVKVELDQKFIGDLAPLKEGN